MSNVAVRKYRFYSAVYHETDEHGRPDCRMGDQDIEYRTFPREELAADARKCSYCARQTPTQGGDGGALARKLEAADPEEVSAR